MSGIESARHVERVVGAGSEDFDRVRARVEELARIASPSLLLPSRVAMVREDEVVVAEPSHDRETLRAVLDARGPLKAGECVWLGIAIAEILMVLHHEGLSHGALDADAIVIAEGRVALTRLVDGDRSATAADDINALGRLLASTVRDGDADRIGAWAEPMTHADSSVRPTAAMVARALGSCAPPEAIVPPPMGIATAFRRAAARVADPGASARASGTEGRSQSAHSSPPVVAPTRAVPLAEARWWRLRLRAERWARRIGIAALGLSLLIGVVAVGVWLVDAAGERAASTQVAAEHGPAQGGVVTGATIDAPVERAAAVLTLARFDALSRGDGEALVELTAEGSPARAAALAMADAVGSGALAVEGTDGRALEGLIEAVERVDADPRSSDADGAASAVPVTEGAKAIVRVTYRLGAHRVTSDGVETPYDAYVQTVDLELVWADGVGWLVSDALHVVEIAADSAPDGPQEGAGPG